MPQLFGSQIHGSGTDSGHSRNHRQRTHGHHKLQQPDSRSADSA